MSEKLTIEERFKVLEEVRNRIKKWKDVIMNINNIHPHV